jgi:pyridoxamine 5'-phosphate oxidase
MAIPKELDPIPLFKSWLEEAHRADLEEPTAMILATTDESGKATARTVLMKGVDDRGFVFYTNLESPKARHLRANPYAALCFHWMPLGKQVCVRGPVTLVSDEEADVYFASRPRENQIAAWASKQSQPLVGRFELERRVAKYALKYGLGKVPRPAFWSGYRVFPESIEFWNVRPFRLHDRLLYRRTPTGWEIQELYP